MLSEVVKHRDPNFHVDFSADGPDFVYDYYDEMEAEAPETNDLIQTGDVVDHMDGWMSGEGTPEYYDALQKDLEEIKRTYQEELNHGKK